MGDRTYLAIDLKSFYASVECVERGLDPLTTNLVVADLSRTEKTICLAVTPSLKAWGISGRGGPAGQGDQRRTPAGGSGAAVHRLLQQRYRIEG